MSKSLLLPPPLGACDEFPRQVVGGEVVLTRALMRPGEVSMAFGSRELKRGALLYLGPQLFCVRGEGVVRKLLS
jgi:hypothetical protein